MTTRKLLGVHLVGSLPCANTTEGFQWIGVHLGEWVSRIPDETGARAGFLLTQASDFYDNPTLEVVPPEGLEPGSAQDSGSLVGLRQMRVKKGGTASDVRFSRLGYADAARTSYELFVNAREAGTLPANARFLFALPTPVSTIPLYVAPEAQGDVLGAYDAQIRATIEEITGAIPHDDLAIQWDLPSEVLIALGIRADPYGATGNMLNSLAQLSNLIPQDIELGFHVCWTDRNYEANYRAWSSHPYLKDVPSSRPPDMPVPDDASELVRLSNSIADSVARPIQFVHIPTALTWNALANYRPLEQLRLHPETELYVGLVHPQDGAEGARTRLELVSEVVDRDFGISTPCGMGRYNELMLGEAADALVTLASASVR